MTDFGSCIRHGRRPEHLGRSHRVPSTSSRRCSCACPSLERLGELVLAVIACTLVFWVVMNLRVYANGVRWVHRSAEDAALLPRPVRCGMLCAMGSRLEPQPAQGRVVGARRGPRALRACPSSRGGRACGRSARRARVVGGSRPQHFGCWTRGARHSVRCRRAGRPLTFVAAYWGGKGEWAGRGRARGVFNGRERGRPRGRLHRGRVQRPKLVRGARRARHARRARPDGAARSRPCSRTRCCTRSPR